MYLKRLELQGFKSFADKTVLEFMPGITTVIGPNGSGKSNIADAIRWVLGEQSMKSLRGAKSEDVIFAGTQNRKSLGFAEASLVFDNSDGKLPIEYGEVTVTRRLYRSGESGYYINKAACRLKDIIELFMDTGIGKDGYSIIGQGKIDEILSNKSEDRRHIFEEAAGIVKYRARKEESEKKLEHTKLNLLRIHDILSEIESNLEPLKAQSEKARKFLDLRAELKQIEIGLFVYQIDSDKQKLEKLKEDIAVMQHTYEENEKAGEEKREQKDKIKKLLDELLEKMESLQNIGLESSNRIEKMNSQINIDKERMENNKNNTIRYQEEMEETKQRIKDLQEEKETKLSRGKSLLANKEKFVKELEEKEKELEAISKKLSAKQLEIEEKKAKVEENTNQKYELQNEIREQEITRETIEKREKTIKNEIDVTISELDEARMRKSEMTQNYTEIETKREKIRQELEQQEENRKKVEEQIKIYEEKQNKLASEIRMKDTRLKFLQETEREKEGYVKSVKSLLLDCEKIKELGKGMHGVLASIIEVPKEYETAIEMCLGAGLQNIVTDSEEDAKRLIEYLREHHLGRASFLPITSVKGKKLERYDAKGIDGVIGIAADLIRYDKKYEGIIFSLLGKTILVEDMDAGIKLAKKNRYAFRIVTLKGDVINSSGAMTGGSTVAKTVNLLGRGREIESLEKELTSLKKEVSQLEKSKQEYVSQKDGVEEQITSIESELQEREIVYATEKQKVVAIEENVEKLENRLAKLKKELEQSAKIKEESKAQQNEKEKKMIDLKEEMEALTLEITEFTKLNQDDQDYLDNLNMDITNLKISVSSFEESENSIQEMTQRIEQDIQNHQKGIESKTKRIEELKIENEQLAKEIEEIEKKIIQTKEEVQNSGSKIEEIKEERQKQNQRLEEIEKEIEQNFKTLEQVKEQMVKMDMKKDKLDQDIETIINNMWEEYEITPNHAQEYPKPENVAATQKQVTFLRGKIRDLGSVNLDSIQEYKQTKERYDFMCEQRLDLENAMEKLRNIITDLTTNMKEQFAEKFKLINQNFNEVFQELFGGGKAELILEDENNLLECGIEIHVQPPGKKLQSMTLLSGGEKAFTAIAILFAILKINPAPFCVLDEIEAALDDVNVYRYAEYLKKFAKQTQFLVITHRKGTMEAADTVYGITMEENGISKLLSMKLH